MDKFKGTPGPWVSSTTDRSIGPVSRDDDQSYGMVLPVAWVEFDGDQRYQQANAKLIAAAPELLEALQGFYDYYNRIYGDDGDYHDEHPIAVAKAAIAKALGE